MLHDRFDMFLWFFFLALLPLLIETVETDKKHGERQEMTCNKLPWLEPALQLCGMLLGY